MPRPKRGSTAFNPPPVPYRTYKRLLLAYNELFSLFANEGRTGLPVPMQEFTMTKLERMKAKYPKTWEQFLRAFGPKLAEELFNNIAEGPNGNLPKR